MKRDPFDDLPSLVQRVYSYVAYVLRDVVIAENVTKATFDLALRHRAAAAGDDAVVFVVALARHQLELRGAVRDGQLSDRELLGLYICAELTPKQIGALLRRPPREVREAIDLAVARRRNRRFALD
jgi:hypothetical protein